MRRGKTLAGLAAVGFALMVVADGTSAQQADAPPPAVTVAPAIRAEIKPIYTFVGQTEAVAEVDLRARVQGFLEERNFVEGEDVAEGAPLFVIEKTAYEAEVASRKAAVDEAEANLALAEATLARRQQAAKSGAVSRLEVDIAAAEAQVAAANLKAAQAALRQADLELSYTDVVSPIDGRIGRQSYSVGNLVTPESGPLATVVKLDPMYVTFNIAEPIYLDLIQARLASGGDMAPGSQQRFTLALPNNTVYEREGTLDFVDNRVDPTTGTIAIRLEYPNPDRMLLPGQFVTVRVQAKEAEEDGLVIPQAAVQEDQAGTFVLVVDRSDTVEIRRVSMGERVGVNWQVLDGLAEGERVIYQGIQKARPGGKVAPVEAAPADPSATPPGGPSDGAPADAGPDRGAAAGDSAGGDRAARAAGTGEETAR